MKTVGLILLAQILLVLVCSQPVPNKYLLQFKTSLSAQLRDNHYSFLNTLNSSDFKLTSKWEIGTFSGYSADIYSFLLLNHISSLPEVQIVERDQVVSISEWSKDDCASQTTTLGLWGLNRISRPQYIPELPYVYNPVAGDSVIAYVVDTGILTTHQDFKGRVTTGLNLVPDESPEDLNGHGTHVAGTIAGTYYGIAKKATLIAVKVLNGAGSGIQSRTIQSLSWIGEQHKNSGSKKPPTVNMSLGGSFSQIYNNAVDALVDLGVVVVVAAGNSNANTCNYSPAGAPKAVTVGATDISDIRAYFSNWGSCVDIMAPGVRIESDWIGSNNANLTISGTSMACPHVSGVATLYISLNPTATALQVKEWLLEKAAKVALADLNGSPDLLLQSGCYN